MIAALHHIDTLDHPGLEPFRTLRRPVEHWEQGIFVAEGEKVVARLLESRLTLRKLLLSPDWFDRHRGAIERNVHSLQVYIGEKKLLETIVGHSLHQSIMAVADVPTPWTMHDLSTHLAAQQRANIRSRIVMVDGITNAENMGVIVRNCVCFGADALIVLPTSCDPYLRRSVRNSMGNIFRLPIIYWNESIPLERNIAELKAFGVTIYGAHPHPNSTDIRTLHPSDRSCIVFGAEGNGISPPLLGHCDAFFTVPMQEGVDSLNVASASAVVLWEFQR